jgi:hypothetical protein
MWFNIVMNNHLPASTFEEFRPTIKYMREVLSLCGHEVTITWDQLSGDAINLYFEFFPNGDFWARNFQMLRRSHGVRIGVVATELMVGGTIPYARHGITYKDKNSELAGERSRARMDGFHAVLKEVDFVWAFLERTASEYRSKADLCEFFPVGCVEVVSPEKRRAPKDVDIAFFGKSTPHRNAIIESLKKSGLDVLVVGAGWPGTGYCPTALLESILDRSKIGLNLTLHAVDDTVDGIDPRFASCIRIVEMLSRETLIVSETIPLDNPYRPYLCEDQPDKLAMLCKSLLEGDRWRQEAKARTEQFRTGMNAVELCRPVIDRTLARLGLPRR